MLSQLAQEIFMTIVDKLRSLKLPTDTLVSLRYEASCDVIHVRDEYVEETVGETGIADTVAALVVDSGLTVQTEYGDGFLDTLRADGLLEDYERGDFAFTDYVAETLAESFYDTGLIEYETKQYDYKRGLCTVSSNVRVPLSELLENPASATYIGGWTTSVKTDNGVLTFD